MTTTRNLIQRLADELTNAIRVIHNEDGTQHISTAAPVLDEARAYLSQPEPEGPTDEELLAILRHLPFVSTLLYARAVIAADRARWGRPVIEPVPVSERPWERERWCDSNGWCWGFDADDTDPFWVFDHPEASSCWTHVLPHYALPVPTTTQEDN